jgi:serine protease Do
MAIQFLELYSWIRRRKIFATLLVFITLGVGIVIGTVISRPALATHDQGANGASLLAIPDPVTLSNGFATISKKLGPSVVNISTTQVIEKPKNGKRPRGSGEPLQDFFDRFFDTPDTGQDAERSLGSGVIVNKNGFILTNDHVIDQATKIQVAIDGDSSHYNAHVVGIDKDTDIAVIKIDAGHDLPVAKLGNSDGSQVGDWVLAFGSPFGLNSTVTAGIISAKDRSMNDTNHQFQRFIQTDAAINPGNSGGPLVNMAGEVIGINTAIYTGGRGFEGVGFAMPSNVVIGVYNQLITNGKVTRGSIGITFQEERSDNPVVLRDLGAPYGIVVELVEPNSPADKAGLQPGDVITKINGQPVHTGADLVNPIAQTAIGQTVQVTVIHAKQSREVSLTVADRSKIFPQTAQAEEDQPGEEQTPGELGLHVEELTPDMTHKLGVAKLTGVIVSEVEPASFADDIGFTRGFVITEINHTPINGLADYRREMAKLKPGQDVLFKVAQPRGTSDRVLTVFLAGIVPSAQ